MMDFDDTYLKIPQNEDDEVVKRKSIKMTQKSRNHFTFILSLSYTFYTSCIVTTIIREKKEIV